jgi:hypothetical protein
MLPIVVVATFAVYLVLSYVYIPPTPSDWKRWFIFGQFKPLDVFSNALYLAPPWIAGLSIARVKPKLVILLPVFVFSYSLSYPIILSIGGVRSFVNLVFVYLAIAYAITALIVATLVIKTWRGRK